MQGGWGAIAQGVTDIGKTVAAGVASKIAWKRTKRILKNRHQWEVADLIAAGLNPILSATKGPGGISGVGPQNIPGGGPIGTTALAGMKLKSELLLLDRQAEALSATAAESRSKAFLNAEQRRKVELEVKEFKPSIGGLGRRFLKEFDVKKFGQTIGDLPQWIKDRLNSAAER